MGKSWIVFELVNAKGAHCRSLIVEQSATQILRIQKVGEVPHFQLLNDQKNYYIKTLQQEGFTEGGESMDPNVSSDVKYYSIMTSDIDHYLQTSRGRSKGDRDSDCKLIPKSG